MLERRPRGESRGATLGYSAGSSQRYRDSLPLRMTKHNAEEVRN